MIKTLAAVFLLATSHAHASLNQIHFPSLVKGVISATLSVPEGRAQGAILLLQPSTSDRRIFDEDLKLAAENHLVGLTINAPASREQHVSDARAALDYLEYEFPEVHGAITIVSKDGAAETAAILRSADPRPAHHVTYKNWTFGSSN